MAPVPKKRMPRSRSNRRKNAVTKSLKLPNLSACPNCKNLKVSHRACPDCGHYK